MRVDVGEEPEYWYEPFGGRYYWNFDNTYFDAPQDAIYTVALWHPQQELGRYSFVVGEREVFGGDRDCMATFNDYWTPLLAGENPYRTAVAEDSMMDESMGDAMGSEMAGDMTAWRCERWTMDRRPRARRRRGPRSRRTAGDGVRQRADGRPAAHPAVTTAATTCASRR